jgi:ribosomal protein S18 acetylase RimI-like enzyme
VSQPVFEIDVYQPEFYSGVLEVAKTLPEWFSKRGLRHLSVDVQHQAGLVAHMAGGVCGFLTYYIYEAEAHIGWMGVHSSAHRTGIGKALIERFQQELMALGIRSMVVDTLGDGVDYPPYAITRAFYRSVGFEDHACIKQDDPEWPERLTLRLAF